MILVGAGLPRGSGTAAGVFRCDANYMIFVGRRFDRWEVALPLGSYGTFKNRVDCAFYCQANVQDNTG